MYLRCLVRLACCLALIALPAVRAAEGYTREVSVKTVMRTSVDAAGNPIEYPQHGKPEVACLEVTVPVGANTGWHTHPLPCVGYILQGEIAVEFEGGKKRIYKAGESLAEAVNVRHCGTNIGSVPVKIVVVAISSKGVPLSKAAPAPGH